MYLFIVNPAAGNGKGKKVWQKVDSILKEKEVSYQCQFTNGPGDGVTIAQNYLKTHAPEQVKGVIAIGGDGTVHEVVNGIVKSGVMVPFGHIPAGSGNDFARAMHLGDWRNALEIILTSAPQQIDVGCLNGQYYFVNSVGAGFDGEVAHYSNQARYKKWLNKVNLGRVTYILSVLKRLFSYKRSRLTIQTKQGIKTWENAWLIAICNINTYGGGMLICPDADPTDGRFQVCVVHGLSRFQLLRFFPKVFKGAHTELSAAEFLDVSEIEVIFDHPVYVHMDGEVHGKTPISIQCIPNRLLALLPGR